VKYNVLHNVQLMDARCGSVLCRVPAGGRFSQVVYNCNGCNWSFDRCRKSRQLSTAGNWLPGKCFVR